MGGRPAGTGDALRARDLERIATALERAVEAVREFTPGAIASRRKEGGDPVTEADTRLNDLLRRLLPREDEGWLSEETADDAGRLAQHRVWVVDPLDGTREFIEGIPEWCVSIGLVEAGEAVAGGICNPASGETILGAVGCGLTWNGQAAEPRRRRALEGAEVLASRSEVGRGEWRRFEAAPFRVRPMGSVAYKLALVAAGRADATWTLVPKHEWDVAAGCALVRAGGGRVSMPSGQALRFNRMPPLLPGLIATAPDLEGPVREFLRGVSDPTHA